MSCNNAGQTASSTIENVGASEIIKIPVLKDTVLKYSDFCSRVEYVPLEVTDKSVIGSVNKMEIASDGSIITMDLINDLMLRFGPDGRFLNQLGRVGNKDDEFIELQDFAYNPFSNEVIVWDVRKSVFLYYDLDGSFLRLSPIDYHNGNIDVLDDSHLVVFEGKRDGDTYKYRYVITSLYDGNEIISEFPDNEPSPIFLGMKIHDINRYNDHIIGHSEYSYQIKEVTINGLKPAYSISYSDKTIPPKWFKMDRFAFDKILSQNSKTTFCDSFFETDNYHLVTSFKNNHRYLTVQERYGDKNSVSGFVAINDMFGYKILTDKRWSCYSPLTVWGIDGNVVYFYIEPEPISDEKYAELLQQICSEVIDPEEQNLILSKWDEYYRICQNDNPVLLKCTLK